MLPPPDGPRAFDDDGDYEYVWTIGGVDVPIPRWLAEIVEVPLIVRWEIFLVGVCTGLILALAVVIVAMFSAH
jgi:hypothetical protein